MKHIFREYDIRGIYASEITAQFTKALGYVLGKIMLSKNAKSVSVGYDARLSNNILHNALIYGLNKSKIKVYSLGLVPTPVGYFSTYKCNIDANIIISASHNPKEYNGFKITINKESFFGDKLANIYNEVKAQMDNFDNKIEDVEYEFLDAKEEYLQFLQEEFKDLKNLNFNISCDLANGAASYVAKEILNRLNIKNTCILDEFDGEFKTHEPDPTEEENLQMLKTQMQKDNSSIAFAFDGDADRVVCLLKDKIIKGDELCYIFAKNMQNPKILCEVKCSKIIYDEINKLGECKMCKTGHSNIKKAIKEHNFNLAAELSGHIFFNDIYFGYDDAIYAMLRILRIYNKNPNFNELLDNLPKSFKSDEIKIKVDENNKFKLMQDFINNINSLNLNASIILIDGVRINYDDGFILLRASNTSPYLITRLEAKSKERLKEFQIFLQKELKKLSLDLTF